jgi:protease YdgD
VLSCVALVGLATLSATHPARSTELPLLPGIGAVDRRVVVDPRQPPWDAVAKVQSNIGTRCTGVLIVPRVVLTAAHCLYNHRTRALLQAGSLHVLIGYDRANYRAPPASARGLRRSAISGTSACLTSCRP